MEQPQFRAARPTCRACYGCSAASRTTPSWNLVLLISRLTVLWVPAIEPGIYENRLIVEERGGRTKISPLPHHNNGRPRSRLENPPRRCRANMLSASIRSRTARPDFKGATFQAGFISCDRKAGFVILRGKTRRSAPCRSRRNIPIPTGPKPGTGAIRRDGDNTHGQQDATGFHRFVR